MSKSHFSRIDASTVPYVLARMKAAPEKMQPEKSELTLRELIAKLYESILAMKAKGYQAEDICEFMREHGVPDIQPTTLNTYLSREKKARKQKKRKQSTIQLTPATALKSKPIALTIAQQPIDIGEFLDAIPDDRRNVESRLQAVEQIFDRESL